MTIGVILAGGLGRRIGGRKAMVRLGGKPLICYPLEAMQRAVSEVAILAKSDTELPGLPGVTVWIEPDQRRHPLVGISQALALAGGRDVVICAADLPFVTPALIERLAEADAGGAPAVVAAAGGETQPLLALYRAQTQPLLRAALVDGAAGRSLRECVSAIGPRLLEVEDPRLLFNVNTPYDVLQAAAMLDRLSQT